MKIMQKAWSDFLSAVNKRNRKTISIFLFFLLLPSLVSAEESSLSALPTLEIKLSQKNSTGDQYQIGDRIALSVDLGPELTLDSNEFSLSLPKDEKKLVDQGWYLDPKTEFNSQQLHFVVAPIQKGSLVLPSLMIEKENHIAIAKTTSWSIQVIGPEKKKEEAALIDIIALDLPAKYWAIFSILGLLLFFACVVFVRRYLKSRKLKQESVSVPVKKQESDHALALRQIESLFKTYPFQAENLKPLSFGISEVLKNYFSHRFHIDARESTTDEMLALLKKEGLPREAILEIQLLFQELDLIKFTKSAHYPDIKEFQYQDFKIKAQAIIQKWALTAGESSK